MAMFRDYFSERDLARNQANRANAAAADRLAYTWDRAAETGNSLNQNQLYYRGGQNAFKNEAPMLDPREGYEWKSQTRKHSLGSPDLYGWYQAKIQDVPQEDQYATNLGNQYGPDIQNLYLQGLLGQEQVTDLTNRGQQGLLSGIDSRPDIQQFANPMSPYAYMPIMQEPGIFNTTPLPEPPSLWEPAQPASPAKLAPSQVYDMAQALDSYQKYMGPGVSEHDAWLKYQQELMGMGSGYGGGGSGAGGAGE